MVGRTWQELGMPADAMKQLDDAWKRVLATGREVSNDIVSPLAGRYYEYSMVPALSERGEVEGAVTTMVDITERKKAEDALRKSEEKFAKAFYSNAANMLLARVDDGRILDINDTLLETIGYSREEVVGHHVSELRIWKYPEQRDQFIRDLRKYGLVREWEAKFVGKNRSGTSLISGQLITLDGEELMLNSSVEITKLKEAEETLRKEEARNRALFELTQMSDLTPKDISERAMEIGIELTRSKIGYITFMNKEETVLTIQHYSKGAMEGCEVEDRPYIFPLETTGLWGEAIRQRRPVITNDYVAPNPLKRGCPKGHCKIIRHMNVPLFDRGKIVAVIGVANKEEDYVEVDAEELSLLMDGMWRIVRKIEAEEAIKRSEMLLRGVVSNLPAVLFTTDVHGIITLSVGRRLDRLKRRTGELVGRSAFDAYRYYPEIKTGIRKALAGVETSWQANLGGIMFQTWAAPMRDEQGTITGVLGVSADITELVEAKKGADEERARLRAILDTLPVGIAITDTSGTVVEVNKQIIEIWGKEAASASVSELGRYDGKRPGTEERLKGEDWTIARALRGETVINEEIDIERFDGTRGTILASGAPIFDLKGINIGALTTVIDITERKELEKDLEEAKSRAELYLELLTHDITNYNTAAMGYLQLAQIRLDLEEKDKKLITRPLQVLSNSSELIANVRGLQLMETGRDRMQTIDVCRMLREVKGAFENPPGREVRFVLDLQDDCSVVASGLLRDAFANIVNNAITHTSGAVTIWISYRREQRAGIDVARISIEDNGPGIADERKDKIFDRAMMGLRKGVSRGLGLYLVKRLIENHNGEAWVEDRIAGDHTQGARFVVVLPVVTTSDAPHKY
jgi:PAS domain S-box-containing protein